jgi:mannosyltransferase
MTADRTAWHERGVWLIILGGFALRLYRLGAQSLWYDETVSAYLASQSIPDLIAHTAHDIHPPAYYLLLHLWTRLAGRSEFALAFFSLAFGLLLIPLCYALARRLIGRPVAVWAALLVAISPYNLWYSQEVRMYTLGAALGLAALWCALGIVADRRPAEDKPARRRYYLYYILAAAAGLYVLYYFAFLLVVLGLSIAGWLAVRRRFRPLRAWLLTQLGVLLLYLPWLPIAWRQATDPPVPPWRSFIPLDRIAVEAWTALTFGQSVQPGQVWPALIVAALLFGLGLIYQISNHGDQTSPARPGLSARTGWLAPARPGLRAGGRATSNFQLPTSNLPRPARRSRGGQPPISNLFLATYTFAPLALIGLVSLVTPLYHVRYLFTYAPPFYILLGAGLAWLQRRAWPVAALAALVVLGGSAFSIRELHTNPRYAADDWRAAVDFIAQRWRPGDAILVNAGYAYTGFATYYDGPIAGRLRLTDFQPAAWPADRPLVLQTGIVGGSPDLGWGDPASDFYATTQADTIAALARVTQAFPRIWVLRIYDTVADPGGSIRDWLAANTTPFEDRLFAGESYMRVQGFMSPAQPGPPGGVETALEKGMTLAGWQSPPSGAAGSPLDVVLWWRAAAPPGADYAVSLKLWGTGSPGSEGSAGLAAQQDEWPLGSLLFTSAWPPGRLIRHPMRLMLPAGLPPGRYWLNVEMYDPVTVRPLSRQDGQGTSISLGPVTVDAQPIALTLLLHPCIIFVYNLNEE